MKINIQKKPYILNNKDFRTIQIHVMFPIKIKKENLAYINILPNMLQFMNNKYPSEDKFLLANKKLYILNNHCGYSRIGLNGFFTFDMIIPDTNSLKENLLEKQFSLFSEMIYNPLIENNYEIKAVVTQPDKKVGRKQKITKSPAKVAAEKHNLPIYQPAKLSGSDEMQELIDMHADLIVTAAYGQFLPTKFLNSVKIAAVNVHGSLLPKYRGGAPIQYSLINGDAETGITIMEMVKKMDAGDIYAQEAIKIQPDDNAGTLFAKLAIVGRDLLLKTLPSIIDGTVKKTPQDPDKVVFSPKSKKESLLA